MGWLFSGEWQREAQLIAHLTGPEFFGDLVKTIAHAERGEVLWSVIEITRDEGELKAGERVICCFLLERDRIGWGYKEMTETMGPMYYTCPLGFLELVPDPGGYATAWRAKVRAAHARETRAQGAAR